MQHTANMMSAMIPASNATEPMTIPAIAPPDSPFFEDEATPVGVLLTDDEVDVEDGVLELVANVMYAVMVGSTTLAQRCSAPEL